MRRDKKWDNIPFFYSQRKAGGQPNGAWRILWRAASSGMAAAGLYRGVYVTGRIGVDELVKKFKADHDDYQRDLTEALADRLDGGVCEIFAQASR